MVQAGAIRGVLPQHFSGVDGEQQRIERAAPLFRRTRSMGCLAMEAELGGNARQA